MVEVRDGSPAAIERELDRLRLQEPKGSACAGPLADAKAALASRDYQNAAVLVGSSWELYRQRRWQVLRHEPENPEAPSAEDRYLAAARAKAEAVLRRFEAVLEGLHKLAAGDPEGEPAGFAPSDALLAEYSAAADGDAQLQVIRTFFAATPAGTEQDVEPGAIYCLQSRGRYVLLQCAQRTHAPEAVSFTRLLTGKPLAPIPLPRLLEEAEKGRLQRLAPLEGAARHADSEMALIDTGSFTLLLAAAQRTEFPVNTDAIISARDRDFRRGEYRKAHGVIEGVAKRFDAAAQQRAQTLAKEELAYRSGTLKMTQRQWQAKLRRDRVNTLNIERAQSYFRRILSALSVMAAQAETPTPPPGEGP